MNKDKIKVLMVMEQCNPEWASVPLLAYNFYSEIRKRADVVLVTHERNRNALEKIRQEHEIHYIYEPGWLKKYYRLIAAVTSKGRVNWPLQHALSYPLYAQFDRAVCKKIGDRVMAAEYDLVHAMTPILPRYPVKIIEKCKNTPFLLGPINGGIPFPEGEGFGYVAKKEFAMFNFLRLFTRLIPGYRKTYSNADAILSGSVYTMGMIKDLFSIGQDSDRVEIFHENGILRSFIGKPKKKDGRADKDIINLLFVGRLVAYKGADIVIEALGRLPEFKDRICFTIVGGGPERESLENLTDKYDLKDVVKFTGWVKQGDTLNYYRKADLFCFPSIREFGGAVALEAMGCGVPCIVADYGGIGEYVSEDSGFKIKPVSRAYLVEQFAKQISAVIENPRILDKMSGKAIERVRLYEWGQKAENMIEIYKKIIQKKRLK